MSPYLFVSSSLYIHLFPFTPLQGLLSPLSHCTLQHPFLSLYSFISIVMPNLLFLIYFFLSFSCDGSPPVSRVSPPCRRVLSSRCLVRTLSVLVLAEVSLALPRIVPGDLRRPLVLIIIITVAQEEVDTMVITAMVQEVGVLVVVEEGDRLILSHA